MYFSVNSTVAVSITDQTTYTVLARVLWDPILSAGNDGRHEQTSVSYQCRLLFIVTRELCITVFAEITVASALRAVPA